MRNKNISFRKCNITVYWGIFTEFFLVCNNMQYIGLGLNGVESYKKRNEEPLFLYLVCMSCSRGQCYNGMEAAISNNLGSNDFHIFPNMFLFHWQCIYRKKFVISFQFLVVEVL